jgi:5'-3' exonuclease
MILLDLNQVMIANFMSQIGNHTDTKIDEGLFRHMVLNSIRALKSKFNDYGELVVACDDKKLWRRDIFPYYKANRKKSRDESELDWSSIFNTLNKIKLELKEYFPYRVIQVEGAEADDVIATLVFSYGSFLQTNKIIILSGDKDFRQLHRYVNVTQYDPINKKFITETDPEKYLKELIIKGDRGDGIPNILSADDSIATGTRQKPISSKKLSTFMGLTEIELQSDASVGTNWERNKKLIDLNSIPESVRASIIAEYHDQENKPRDKIFNYMINNKMKFLIEHINEF